MPDSFAAVIGKQMIIKGRIHSTQDIILHGEVEGELDVQNCRLTIGPTGKALANAKAREVDVQGLLQGDVQSTDKISIRTGGQLVGDIRTAGIVIEDGGFFKGNVDIVNLRPHGKSGGDA
jgi:cytoskeletal protein CcmA (bactofilin family)